jgi:hypothetical protein
MVYNRWKMFASDAKETAKCQCNIVVVHCRVISTLQISSVFVFLCISFYFSISVLSWKKNSTLNCSFINSIKINKLLKQKCDCFWKFGKFWALNDVWNNFTRIRNDIEILCHTLEQCFNYWCLQQLTEPKNTLSLSKFQKVTSFQKWDVVWWSWWNCYIS